MRSAKRLASVAVRAMLPRRVTLFATVNAFGPPPMTETAASPLPVIPVTETPKGARAVIVSAPVFTTNTPPAPPAAHPGEAGEAPAEPDPTAPLRQRLLVSLALTVPVVALSMVPALQFDNWQWLALTLASVSSWWAGWRCCWCSGPWWAHRR